MSDEPGKTPDDETDEQPPPPDELPGDRRTDKPGIDESAQGLGDLLDEPDQPNVLSQEETDYLRGDMVRRNLETQKAEEAEEGASTIPSQPRPGGSGPTESTGPEGRHPASPGGAKGQRLEGSSGDSEASEPRPPHSQSSGDCEASEPRPPPDQGERQWGGTGGRNGRERKSACGGGGGHDRQ